MQKDYDITKTKLIIWDLDETLWDGILSEGGIVFKPEILNFIEELTTKGIVNSICSKNTYADVKNKFLFNSVILKNVLESVFKSGESER